MTIYNRFNEFPEEFDDYYSSPSFNALHYYNLQNQSWGIPRKDKEGDLKDPVDIYFAELSRYPSNYETVWIGLQYQPVAAGEDPYERIYPNLYEDSLGTDVKAAKGYYIIDLLRRGASRSEAYAANKNKYPSLSSPEFTPKADFTSKGASVVSSWAGRAFYAGFSGEVVDGDIRSPNLANLVVFSVLIQGEKDFFRCHQEGDPTSREGNDVVDTDGGFIKISGAERILSLIPMKNSLIVVANNGVWAITGGSDFGFTATNYKVDKLSSFSGIGRDSIVEAGGFVYFWGQDGIYQIIRNQVGDLEVANLTEGSIQTLYQAIPNTSKENAIGIYDSISKTLHWIYKTGTAFSSDSQTYELILNVYLAAFSRNRIVSKSDNSTEVFSLFSSTDFRTSDFDNTVIIGNEDIVIGVDDVFIPSVGRVNALQSSRYLAVTKLGSSYTFSFSYYNDPLFLDWNESDASAFLVTGENIASDSSVAKQIPYLTMHFIRTEDEVDEEGIPTTPSGCLVRVQWDWARNSNSRKFGTAFQAYRQKRVLFSEGDYDDGHLVLTSKSKVRGRGKAFAMHIETEPGKDCQLLGWNISVNGNAIT